MESDTKAPEVLSREDAYALQLAHAQVTNARLQMQVIQTEIAGRHKMGPLDQFNMGQPGEVKIERAK